MATEPRILIPEMSWNLVDDKPVDIVAGFREVTKAANEAVEKIAELGRKIIADPQLHTEQLLLEALDEDEGEVEDEEAAFDRKVQLFRMNAKTAFPYAPWPELCWVLEAAGVKADHVVSLDYNGTFDQYIMTLIVSKSELLNYEELLIVDEPFSIAERLDSGLTVVTFNPSGDLEATLKEFSPYFVTNTSPKGSWGFEA